MKALEADDSSAQTTVKNKKIDLRNMPANVPAVGTFADADAVKAYWPSGGAFGVVIELGEPQPAGRQRARTQQASSTLVVTPGQWQPLGQITVSESQSATGLGGASTRSDRFSLPLEVKVEIGGE